MLLKILIVLCTVYLCTAKHARVCGRSNHNKTTGELFPHNEELPPDHTCEWHIYPESYNILEVFMVVEEFQLESADSFSISKHDGPLLFGPFHGHKSTFSILMGELYLDLTLMTAASPETNRKFKSHYTAKGCYYLIEDEVGSMASPLYDSKIKRSYNITCTWEFRKFKQIVIPRRVVFNEFHLLNSTMIVKGSEAQDGEYSGTKMPPDIVAVGETVIILNLNTAVPDEIFNFSYAVKGMNENELITKPNQEKEKEETKAPPIDSKKDTLCGTLDNIGVRGVLSPKSETINANHECFWKVDSSKVPKATEIYLYIEEFLLADDDSFTVSGTNGDTLFGPYHGQTGPFSILTGELTINTHLKIGSSQPLWARKFKAIYMAKNFNNEMNDLIGIVKSPFYSSSLIRAVTITWTFNFQIPSLKESISFVNYNVTDGKVSLSDKEYTGTSNPPDTLITTGETLKYEFDTKMPNQAFKFIYIPVTASCSSSIKLTEDSPSVSISTPNFSEDSPDNALSCLWMIETPVNTVVTVHIDNIILVDAQDSVIITDGSSRTSPILQHLTIQNLDKGKDSNIISSNNSIWISFSTPFPFKGSTFKAKIEISKHGGFYRGEGKFTMKSSDSGSDVIYFLEVEKNKQVLLTLPEQNLPSKSIIEIYNDFSIGANLITVLKGEYFYPIVSVGNKMMIIGKDLEKDSSVEFIFQGIEKGCHQVTLDAHDTYTLAGNCNKTCSWTIPPVKNGNEESSLHISAVALNPMDKIQIYILNEGIQYMTTIYSADTRLPTIYLPTSNGAYINTTRGTCSEKDQTSTVFSANVHRIRGCSLYTEIKSGNMIQITSPNYPDTYPLLAHCWTNISAETNNFLYLSFKKFQLANGHCLRLYDKGGSSVVKTYNNSITPEDIVLKQNTAIELIAKSCIETEITTNRMLSGDGYLAEVFSTDCGGLLDKTMEDSFSSPGYPNPVSKNLCIWKVQVRPTNNDSVNIIAFSIEWAKDNNKTGLKIYNGPSMSSNLLSNISSVEMLSRTNTLIFVFQKEDSSSSSDYAGFKINYQLRACSSLCDNKICMHPDWPCNGIDECGDFSDEKDCQGRSPLPPPIPPKPPNKVVMKNGVSALAVGLSIPAAFVGGILFVILGVIILQKYKNRSQENYGILPIYNE